MSGVQEATRQALRLIKFIRETEQETPERLKELADLLSTECLVPNFECKQFSPLHYAVAQGLDGITDILLKNKANPNAVGKNSITPAKLAACIGSEKCLGKLIEYRADVDARTSLAGTENLTDSISVDSGEWPDLKASSPLHIREQHPSALGCQGKPH